MSHSIEIISQDKTDEAIKEIFKSILSRYRIGLETSIKDSDFIFDFVNLLYYKCNKTNFNRSGSYIHSPDWIKNRKAAINPINKNDNKCFSCAFNVLMRTH